MADKGSYILLFDGVCNLCSGIVKFIIRRDPHEKFHFAALQSESGQSIMKKFGLNQQSMHTMVLVHADRYYVKSTAALQLFRAMGGLWKMLYIFIIISRPIRDIVYDGIAKSRYTIFGIRDSCLVPDADVRHRFLL